MKTVAEYLRDAEVAHGHLCAGQVLGVRMAMLGLRQLEIEDPEGKDRKRLVTFVEIDRCATDATAPTVASCLETPPMIQARRPTVVVAGTGMAGCA